MASLGLSGLASGVDTQGVQSQASTLTDVKAKLGALKAAATQVR
jgi:hypothetical protein